MKQIVLTIDYEIFLGEITGDVRTCIYEPMKALSEVISLNDGKMTIFWDVLHYYRMSQLCDQFNEFVNDMTLIESQIHTLISEGHDVQLHIHPHWIDAKYVDGRWKFLYDRFSLQALSTSDDIHDINTIIGCVSISKNILESIIRKIKPNYVVTTFRAGGYLVQPFDTIKQALFNNEILIDSSVCPGLQNENMMFSYNFEDYPTSNCYNFFDNPKFSNSAGPFLEVPISTLRIPVLMNIYFTLLRRFKYYALTESILGSGAWQTTNLKQPSFLKKAFDLLFKAKVYQFTTDGNFNEILKYMFLKTHDKSVLILHSKLLNTHILTFLKRLIKKGEIQFITLEDFLSRLK